MKARSLCLVILLSLFLFRPLTPSAAVLETDNGIFYSIENGEVTIEGFNEAGTAMKVPSEIDGYPVRYVASHACRGNTVITELRLPDTLLSIGEFAFADCPSLRKVTINGGTDIAFSAFRNCPDLKSVSLPDTLLVIDDCAFEGCVVLGKIKIPASVESIGVDAFAGCSALRLDVSDNPMAKEYAKRYAIPTDFTETWEFTLLKIAFITVLLGAVIFLPPFLLKKRKKKCAEENIS